MTQIIPPGASPQSPPNLRIVSKSFLVIEDDYEDYFSLERVLRSTYGKSCKINHCDNGEDAIETITKKKYDLILADYHIKEKTLSDFLNLIDLSQILSPIVIITGKDINQIKKEENQLRSIDVIKKDLITKSNLMNSIESSLLKSKINEININYISKLKKGAAGEELKRNLALIGFVSKSLKQDLVETKDLILPATHDKALDIINEISSLSTQLHKMLNDTKEH